MSADELFVLTDFTMKSSLSFMYVCIIVSLSLSLFRFVHVCFVSAFARNKVLIYLSRPRQRFLYRTYLKLMCFSVYRFIPHESIYVGMYVQIVHTYMHI